MSRSIHIAKRNFQGLSKKELDEQATDPYSELSQWARKSETKKTARAFRRIQRSDFATGNNSD
ncbi:hypothetical protein GCM10023184_28100 [Flaviaesturariibacter amylovorans]|uniref:Uncharacterized protein n=1 Tax=Flaviaesturariibacter amylovorans TaxID=1084520 RepID=A0ABP8H4W9_9BACT